MSASPADNQDSNISVESSTVASCLSSLPASEMETNVESTRDLESVNGEESESQYKLKEAEDQSNEISSASYLNSGESTVATPVIPLPPDESAQDASDVVMETTAPADIKDLQTATRTSVDVPAESAKEASVTDQSSEPTQSEPTQSEKPSGEQEGQAKQEQSTEDSETKSETVEPKVEEFTFKIPKTFGQSLRAVSGENSQSGASVESSENQCTEKSDELPCDATPVSEPCVETEQQVTSSEASNDSKTKTTDGQTDNEESVQPASSELSASIEQTPDDTADKTDDTSTPADQPDASVVNGNDESQAKDGDDVKDQVPKNSAENTNDDVEMKDDDSVADDPTKSSSRKRRNSAADSNTGVAEGEEVNENAHHVSADQLFEYQWPPDKTGEYYFLQEQISEYLTVKSFKRKYPDLQRRPVEVQERMFLREKGIVTETQCDLGLTALKSEEVYDLMLKDYSEKYQDYVQVLQEKERRTISEKHKEYGMPKVDKGRMKEYMMKAVKSAAEFNTHFMRELREERKAYFDLQTFQVMYPCGQMKKLPPEMTKPSTYPVALIPGQFQEHYKKYSPQELKYFPLNTVLYDPPKNLSNIYAKPKQEGESDSEESITSEASLDSVHTSSSGSSRKSSGSSNAEQEDISCHICSRGPEKNVSGDQEDLVTCSECARSGHPSCLEITDEMIPMIKTYSWQCMECKTCVECMDPYDEDKMMFCDHCDRGYHTFCVGLRSIPTGQWECPSCRPDEPKPKQRRTRTR